MSIEVLGGEERQVRCQGVAHVLQERETLCEGLVLQIMQIPSPSPICAMKEVSDTQEGLVIH